MNEHHVHVPLEDQDPVQFFWGAAVRSAKAAVFMIMFVVFTIFLTIRGCLINTGNVLFPTKIYLEESNWNVLNSVDEKYYPTDDSSHIGLTYATVSSVEEAEQWLLANGYDKYFQGDIDTYGELKHFPYKRITCYYLITNSNYFGVKERDVAVTNCISAIAIALDRGSGFIERYPYNFPKSEYILDITKFKDWGPSQVEHESEHNYKWGYRQPDAGVSLTYCNSDDAYFPFKYSDRENNIANFSSNRKNNGPWVVKVIPAKQFKAEHGEDAYNNLKRLPTNSFWPITFIPNPNG